MNGKSKNAAFTLAELLIVIAIIAILVTIGVVAGGRAYCWANIKETRANMGIIMNAVMAFQENTQAYPTAKTSTPANPRFLLCVKLDSSNNPVLADAGDETLSFQLVANPFAQERLRKLPEDAFSDGFSTHKTGDVVDEVRGGLLDAWHRPYLYSPHAGLGGTPVLVSAGPDGKIWDGSGTSDSDTTTVSSMGTSSGTPINADRVLDITKPGNADNIFSDSE